MGYRVVIPTAGTGSRLGDLTKHINKSLVSIANRPTISHLIELFPQDCEFVIALGYKGGLVRDFLELTYPDRVFFFAEVDLYEGQGSGLGYSLLACEQYLQQPFVFLSCDTLVKEAIPEPTYNWMGYSKRDELSQYRTLDIDGGNVSEICEKGILRDHAEVYIGLAGVQNFQQFWQAMHTGKDTAISQGESYGMKDILKSGKVVAHEFTWFDTGNLESIQVAREVYSEPNEPNILEKENEAIWFIGDIVLKYSNDTDFVLNRVKRATELHGFVPSIVAYRDKMYSYQKAQGGVLSDVVTLPIFENFLTRCQHFWVKKKLSTKEQQKFQNSCLAFYKDKTCERIQLFYKNFNQIDNAEIINGEMMPPLQSLLDKVDWDWISQGLSGRFHGDFHFENILYSKGSGEFVFLDWRQDFAGDLSVGDIYYDFAKLMHGLIINHGIIASNHYTASWSGNEITYDFHRKQILVECESEFNAWLQANNYDLKKIRLLTALIYLNIAALHHYPYSILLYGLGKSMLKRELNIYE